MKSCCTYENSRQGRIGRILFELGKSTLLNEINSKSFTHTEKLKILKDVSVGLMELHDLGIYHLDVKPENVILVGNTYKLCDFGSVLTKTVHFDQLTQ